MSEALLRLGVNFAQPETRLSLDCLHIFVTNLVKIMEMVGLQMGTAKRMEVKKKDSFFLENAAFTRIFQLRYFFSRSLVSLCTAQFLQNTPIYSFLALLTIFWFWCSCSYQNVEISPFFFLFPFDQIKARKAPVGRQNWLQRLKTTSTL